MLFQRKDAEHEQDAQQIDEAAGASGDAAFDMADDAAWEAWAAGSEPVEPPPEPKAKTRSKRLRRAKLSKPAKGTKRMASSAEEEPFSGAPSETALMPAVAPEPVAEPVSQPLVEDDEAAAQSMPLDPARRQERQERLAQIERSRKKRQRKKVVRRIMWALFGLFMAGVAALLVVFVLNRWYTYDDAADMVGTWRLEGTDMQVEITEDTIRLTDEVAYKYTIDPADKTIAFKFGNMEGQGRYRFSLDRQELSITDGSFDFWGTLLSDMPWTLAAALSQVFGVGTLTPGVGDGVTALTRELALQPGESSDTSTGALDVPQGSGGEGVGAQEGADAAADTSVPESADGSADAPIDSSSSAADSAGEGTRDVDALDLPTDA